VDDNHLMLYRPY